MNDDELGVMTYEIMIFFGTFGIFGFVFFSSFGIFGIFATLWSCKTVDL